MFAKLLYLMLVSFHCNSLIGLPKKRNSRNPDTVTKSTV